MKINCKHIICFGLFLCIIFSSSSCTRARAGEEASTNISEYGQYNDYVKGVISERTGFRPCLVDEINVENYSYTYRSDENGRANFCIYLSVRYDEIGYKKELKRLTEFKNQKTIKKEEDAVLFLEGNLNKAHRLIYEDEKTDVCYYFETAHANAGKLTIEYLTAMQWNHKEIPQAAEAYLKNILNLFQELWR